MLRSTHTLESDELFGKSVGALAKRITRFIGAKYYFDGPIINRSNSDSVVNCSRFKYHPLFSSTACLCTPTTTDRPTNQALTVKEKHRLVASQDPLDVHRVFSPAKQEKMEWKTTTFPIIVERRPLFIDRSRCPRTWLHSANTTTVSTSHHHHLSSVFLPTNDSSITEFAHSFVPI